MTTTDVFDFIREIELKTEELEESLPEIIKTGFLSEHTVRMLKALVTWRRVSSCLQNPIPEIENNQLLKAIVQQFVQNLSQQGKSLSEINDVLWDLNLKVQGPVMNHRVLYMWACQVPGILPALTEEDSKEIDELLGEDEKCQEP